MYIVLMMMATILPLVFDGGMLALFTYMLSQYAVVIRMSKSARSDGWIFPLLILDVLFFVTTSFALLLGNKMLLAFSFIWYMGAYPMAPFVNQWAKDGDSTIFALYLGWGKMPFFSFATSVMKPYWMSTWHIVAGVLVLLGFVFFLALADWVPSRPALIVCSSAATTWVMLGVLVLTDNMLIVWSLWILYSLFLYGSKSVASGESSLAVMALSGIPASAMIWLKYFGFYWGFKYEVAFTCLLFFAWGLSYLFIVKNSPRLSFTPAHAVGALLKVYVLYLFFAT